MNIPKEPREDIVAYVEKGFAIDYTPIYTLRFHKNIKAGDTLRFDVAQKFITREAKNYYAKRK